jgi:ABC-type nitrate/sulfonate/bicarbonate transport system substrate-binding protein
MRVVPSSFARARLLTGALAGLALALAACAPAAQPSPTAAPAKPAEAAKPAATAAPAKPTEAPAAKPAEAKPAASPAAKAEAKPAASPAAAAKPAEAKPAASPAAKAVALPKPERTSIKIGSSALEPTQFAYRFAMDLGLYKKYGIENVEDFYFDGAGKLLQAMVANQVDVGIQSGGPIISSLTAGSPMQMTAMYSSKVSDLLVGVANVKSAADLRGKSVAVSQFGGESHAVVLLALKALGLSDRDVTIQQVGGQSARIAALKAGSIAAAPVDVTLEDQMKQEGFNVLIRLPDTPLDLARSGLSASADFIQKNPNTMLVLTAASLEALQVMYTDTGKAVESFARWTQAKDTAQAEKGIKDYLQFARRDMRWSREAWEVVRDVIASQNPDIRNVDLTKAFTFQFLDQLRDMGFNDAVGVPRS